MNNAKAFCCQRWVLQREVKPVVARWRCCELRQDYFQFSLAKQEKAFGNYQTLSATYCRDLTRHFFFENHNYEVRNFYFFRCIRN